MSRTMTLSALAAAALLAAAGFAPGAASAGEFETNARRCADPLGDLARGPNHSWRPTQIEPG